VRCCAVNNWASGGAVWGGLNVGFGSKDSLLDYDQYICKHIGTVAVSTPGVKALGIIRREEGYQVDRIVLTQGAAPTGTGPAESPR
jgi:hypothetical protein